MENKLLKHGAFSWFELSTTNVDGAKRFYTNLFGWETEDMPMPNMTYSVVKVDGESAAGIMPNPPDSKDMPPTWGIYITVSDIDATVAKAKELGGTILIEPRDIPDVGKFCVIQDPQGAWFEAMQYKEM